MRKKDPSIIATIGITIVIALALAGVGYYYLDKQHQKELQSIKSNQDSTVSETRDTTSDQSTNSETGNNTQESSDNNDADNNNPQDTSSWKIYSNKTYGFSFKYPSDKELSSIGLSSDDLDYPEQQILDGDNLIFKINYLTIDDYRDSGNTDLFQLPIKEFAQEYYNFTAANKNFDDNQIGKITSVKIGAENGYSFTTTTGFDGPWGGSSENRQSTHVFLENNIDKIVITYPTGDNTAETILSTLIFE